MNPLRLARSRAQQIRSLEGPPISKPKRDLTRLIWFGQEELENMDIPKLINYEVSWFY
jgi:hypothetical protein